MKIRTFGRHIRDAFKSLFRNGVLMVRAVSAVSMTLTLVGFFTVILLNVNKIATDIEQDVTVRVYIEQTADQAAQDTLKAQIQAIDNVATVVFRSKDEELEALTKNWSEFKLFGSDSNPLRDTFDVSTTSPSTTQSVAEAIEMLPNVVRVNYGGADAEKLFNVIGTIRNIGIVIIIGLLLSAMFLISNTVRSTIYARKTEIEIMKLVGAKNSYIRWPFFLEGGLIGLFGSIIPIVLVWSVYLFAYPRLSDALATTNYALLEPSPFLLQISFGIALIGIFIGSFGAASSVRRFLKI